MRASFPFLLAVLLLLGGCGGVKSLRQAIKGSPYEKYADGLKSAGLDRTALGSDWLRAGQQTLSQPFATQLPFRETGYFSAEKASSVSYRIVLQRGEKLVVRLETQSREALRVFLDLFEREEKENNVRFRRVAYADSTGQVITHEPKRSGTFIVRLQPELLRSGQYTLVLERQPSLSFPVQGKGNAAVGSLFGVARDGGRRSHEGVDIFAPKRTPVLAATEGYISGVNQNSLGGKVVWQEDPKRNVTLYYAHLDSQLVSTGQEVKPGDILGLVGNTGNARTTPSHLHFGIYTSRGAIDPYPFIRQENSQPKPVTADMSALGNWRRTTAAKTPMRLSPEAKGALLLELPQHTLLRVEGGADRWYRVSLPDGTRGYLLSAQAEPLDKPLAETAVKTVTPLLDFPDARAIPAAQLVAGTRLSTLASFGFFRYVRTEQGLRGWLPE